MTIKLPPKFNTILSGVYREFVETAINRLKDIYSDNKLEFFQEYTDHGIEHIEKVLETSENIIEPESFELLNEKDIAVLTISILLHDLGMHISKDGLKKLLSEDYHKWQVPEFDLKSWSEEWRNYYQEAKRFNDEELTNIFGNSNQIIAEANLDLMDNYTRKLYGEFLRRHHHRLAHEIALGGFPTPLGEENIQIANMDVESDLIDLAGLVARSHGMPIRKALDYLENKFQEGWRSPYGVKAIFLMVVLRIADYLQIHSNRASKILLKSKRFDSPISIKEWEKHNAIKDISVQTADPERIFVIVKPENSVIYLELENLFKNIQSELDTSWAILGEAYGKDTELRKLKIKFRRIRSVLDNKEKFTKTITYVPERIFFNADPTLLKLLIGPLYGEDPQYGVRELLQNSVDAIKERVFLNKIEGKITISLQPVKAGKPRYEIVISDTGIGMSEDTIINYFFKAGASFRKSMIWKKNFIDDNEVKIQKTGRFGVGVLAVFLLGNEFELWTKFDSKDSQGYYCKASLGMTQVELNKVDCSIGTTIKIPLKESANVIINSKLHQINKKDHPGEYYYERNYNLLEWFTWYAMDFPKIEYKIDKNISKAFKFSNLFVSSIPENASEGWKIFSTKDYKSVQWTLDLDNENSYYGSDTSNKYFNKLLCNGFKIKKGYNIRDSTYKWREPKISVFDNNANFPLGLNRDYIQEDTLPFEEELIENMCIEIFNTLLKTEFEQIGPVYCAKPNYLKFLYRINLSEYVVIIDDEFTLLNPTIFFKLKQSSLTQFWIKRQAKPVDFNIRVATPYQIFVLANDTIAFYKQILDNSAFEEWFSLSKNGQHIEDVSSRKFISLSKLEYLLQGSRLNKTTKDTINRQKLSRNWEEIISGSSIEETNNTGIDKLNPDIFPIIVERFLKPVDSKDFFMKVWEKYLGQEWSFPIEVSKRPVLSLD